MPSCRARGRTDGSTPVTGTTTSPLPTPVTATPARRRAALIGLSLGYIMVLLDTTVVNVALPAIQHDLGAGVVALQWVTAGYTLTFAALLLTAGALTDRFGGRRVFLAGAGAFGGLSAVCALAPDPATLVALRALLGAAGALLLPSSLAVISGMFTDRALRARALGSWAAITGLALVAGPPVGGLLTQLFSWRAVFVVNVPIAAAAVAVVRRCTRPVAAPSPRELDPAGQLLAVLTLGTLTAGLTRAGDAGWADPWTAAGVVAAGAGAVAFVAVERRRERAGRSPMLPVTMFRDRTFSGALFAGLVVNFGIAGALFLLSLFFQQARGWSSLTAGLAFLPMTLPTALNPVVTGRIVARIGPRCPAALGMVLIAAGAAVQAGATGGSRAAVVVGLGALVLVGYGISFALPALVAGLMATVPAERAGIASGALNAARQTGAVLGVAVLGGVLSAGPTAAAGTRNGMLITAALALVAAGVVLAAVGRRPR